MKNLVIIYSFIGFFIGQSFNALPNNVFRFSIDQASSKYQWDRGKHNFSLDGIGKMYFDPFTHNDSVRFSSNFDLYHTGSVFMGNVVVGEDTLKPASTVESWMEQFNTDYNFTFINLKLSLIHFKLGPMDIKNKNGINNGTSNSLKKGGPIEIFSFSITSKNIG